MTEEGIHIHCTLCGEDTGKKGSQDMIEYMRENSIVFCHKCNLIAYYLPNQVPKLRKIFKPKKFLKKRDKLYKVAYDMMIDNKKPMFNKAFKRSGDNGSG